MVDRGGGGDAELVAFCRDAHPRLVAALTHQLGDRWLAEEVAQEALIRVCDRWDRVRAMDSPVGWAFHVGTNIARSRVRRRGAERRAMARRGAEPDAVDDPDTADRLLVAEALERLAPGQRRVVVLRWFLGLTPSEVAQVTGTSATAVRTTSSRALARLRDVLAVADEEHADVP